MWADFFTAGLAYIVGLREHFWVLGAGFIAGACEFVLAWKWPFPAKFAARTKYFIEKNRNIIAFVTFVIAVNIASFLAFWDQYEKSNKASSELAALAAAHPIVSITFEPDRDILSPSQRKLYNDWLVKLRVETNKKLNNASLNIFSVMYRENETKKFELISGLHKIVARYNWKETFNTISVDGYEEFALIETAKPDNSKMFMLVDGREPELAPLRNLKPGQ